MAITVSYKDLVNQLEKEFSISFTTTENPKKVQRKISMAKHREGIAGKLIFSHTTTKARVGPEVVDAYVMTVVLTPKKDEVIILGMNKDEKHSL